MSAVLPEPNRCCIQCKQTKSADAFERQTQDGRRRNQCRLCRNPRMIKHNRKRREARPRPVRVVQIPSLINYPFWPGPVSPGQLSWSV